MPDPQLLPCPACGAMNRVPAAKLAQGLQPICGRCKKPFPVSHHPITITDANFADEVERSPLPVLLDLWAPWCGPCKMIAPAIEQLATEMAGRLRVGKLNVDENPLTSDRFQVRGIPALLIFQNGREVDRLVGAHPKAEIQRHLQAILG